MPTSGQSPAVNSRVLGNELAKSKQGVFTNASAELLAAATNGRIVIDKILLTERSNASRTVTLRHLNSGDTDDATADLFTDLPLAAKETVVIDGPIVLESAESIKGLASANTSVNYYIAYREER